MNLHLSHRGIFLGYVYQIPLSWWFELVGEMNGSMGIL